MLYSEIIAVCSQIHTKHTNTLYGQDVEFLNVKPGDSKVTVGHQTFNGSIPSNVNAVGLQEVFFLFNK
jgi:hypothetical protein